MLTDAASAATFEPAPVSTVPEAEAFEVTARFLEAMRRRRSIRQFSDRPVPYELVRRAVETAATAPSGGNSQPWRFVIVGSDEIKTRLRQASEVNEHGFYHERATPQYLSALRPIGTNWHKPFFETAPWLVVVFEVLNPPPQKRSFYAKESVGIAVGLLLASLQQAGIGTLTYTSVPFRWVNGVLGRPSDEHPFAIIGVGHPADDAVVPVLHRKTLDEVMLVDPEPEDAP